MMDSRPTIVIDTNAWLDLLLFEDPRASALREALRDGVVSAIASEPCREEWSRVLGYPQLGLDPARRRALTIAFDELVHSHDVHADFREPIVLPRCRDRDDQKFVQLAYDTRARWLVSRDREVLALGRRTARAGWFEILTPQAWSLTGTGDTALGVGRARARTDRTA
ncbi:MAG: putative toxin-antitoxin system toxin component, PIN family [Lysobacter sp.]|nr:putative toxin-antitoxin system toxin component, PIN family [Lysobacter sp.]MDQ3269355.1 putative toxin-antitoxin system toxin component, PIN family [Pseudomonadota bacterium]